MMRKFLFIYFLVAAPVLFLLGLNWVTSRPTIVKMIQCDLTLDRTVTYRVHPVAGPLRQSLQRGFNEYLFEIGGDLAPKADEIEKIVRKNVSKYRNETNNLFVIIARSDWILNVGVCRGGARRRCAYRGIMKSPRCGDPYQIIELIEPALALPDEELPKTYTRPY